MAKSNKSKTPSTPVGVPQVRNTGPIIAIGAVVLALLVVVAVVATYDSDSDDPEAAGNTLESQPVTVTGDPLPPAPSEGAPDTAAGQPAPVLSGKTFTGEPVNIGPSAQPKVLMFFAHWCQVCQREVPVVTEWLDENAGKFPVEYYAISTGARPGQSQYPPSEFFAGEEFPLPVMADNSQNAAANAYGLGSYPYFVFLDAQNNVVGRTSGELDKSRLTQLVQQLVPATPTP